LPEVLVYGESFGNARPGVYKFGLYLVRVGCAGLVDRPLPQNAERIGAHDHPETGSAKQSRFEAISLVFRAFAAASALEE
jgi:hypothetical protein